MRLLLLLGSAAPIVAIASGGGTGGGAAIVGVGIVASGGGSGSGSASTGVRALAIGGGVGSGGSIVAVGLRASGGGTGFGSVSPGTGAAVATASGGGTSGGTAMVGIGLVASGGGVGSGVAIVSQGTTAYDLAEAIAARFAATAGLSGFTKLFESAVGSSPVTPYAVFTITSGTLIRTTSTSHFSDRRLRFDVFADTQDLANALLGPLHDAFNATNLSYQTGYSIPLVEMDRCEERGKGRVVGSKLTFKSSITFSARCRKAV